MLARTLPSVGVVAKEEGRNREWKTSRANHHRTSIYRRTPSQLVALALVALLCIVAPAAASDIGYCSTQNTGSDFKKVTNIWQSHGACRNVCVGKYAFAIVQGNGCWCSNYAPSSNDQKCTDGCPGYPPDKCGNSTENTFAYVALVLDPSGTVGAVTKATVSPTSAPPPLPPPPPAITVTEEKEGSVETVTIVTIPKTTEKSKPTEAPEAPETPETPETPDRTTPIISVVTKVGGVQTVTLVSGNIESSEANEETTSSADSGISGGAIAGIVVGIVLAVLLIAAAIIIYRHRKKKAAMDAEAHSEKIGAGGAGIVGGESKRRSRSLSTLGLVTADKASPASSGAGVPTDSISGAATASAQPVAPGDVYDPRLDPGTLFNVMRYDHNTGSSRMSVRSLRDDADYSRRVLRLANPDDDAQT